MEFFVENANTFKIIEKTLENHGNNRPIGRQHFYSFLRLAEKMELLLPPSEPTVSWAAATANSALSERPRRERTAVVVLPAFFQQKKPGWF